MQHYLSDFNPLRMIDSALMDQCRFTKGDCMTQKELEDRILEMIYSNPLGQRFNEQLRQYLRQHVKAVQ